MEAKISASNVMGWMFGVVLLTIGVLNIIFIHPTPGIIYLLLSLVYFPPANTMIKNKLNISIPNSVKIVLGFVVIWFTLGVSDLGDMID